MPRFIYENYGHSAEYGGQFIDLIIDRADNCIHLCEMKFCDSEFIIDKAYAKKLEQKKEIFQRITGTHKTLFLTLITPYGVKENEHYIGLIDQQLTLDSLFPHPFLLKNFQKDEECVLAIFLYIMDMIRSKYSAALKALSKKAVFSSANGREVGIPPRMLAYFRNRYQASAC